MQIKRQKVRMHRRRRDEFERKASLIILFPRGTRKHDRSAMRLLPKRSPVVRYCTPRLRYFSTFSGSTSLCARVLSTKRLRPR